ADPANRPLRLLIQPYCPITPTPFELANAYCLNDSNAVDRFIASSSSRADQTLRVRRFPLPFSGGLPTFRPSVSSSSEDCTRAREKIATESLPSAQRSVFCSRPLCPPKCEPILSSRSL